MIASIKPPRRSPDVSAMLRDMTGQGIDFVLIGSVALSAWGVDIGTPGDLDIVPRDNPGNLARLKAVLEAWRARSWPITGEWVMDESGERDWANLAPTDPHFGTHLPDPDPVDITTFDSMYETIHGDFDIVPLISGTYQDLAPRSSRMNVSGVPNIQVISIADLLIRLTVPRRDKDHSRVAALREVQLHRFRAVADI